MREPYIIEINGTPKAQPRPRMARSGHVYNPKSADDWKQAVVSEGRAVRPADPIDAAIRVDMVFRLPRPQRLGLGPRCPHIAKPDKDNLEKAVLDALTADGWFHDDALVCSGHVSKCYAASGEQPGATIRIVLEPNDERSSACGLPDLPEYGR